MLPIMEDETAESDAQKVANLLLSADTSNIDLAFTAYIDNDWFKPFVSKVKEILDNKLGDLEQILEPLDVKSYWDIFKTPNFFDKIYELNLTDIELGEFPQYLTLFKNLDTLYMENCGIESMPNDMTPYKNIVILSLFDNPITSIPQSIGRMNKLRELTISGSFESFPETINYLRDLETLILQSPNLTSLPESIENCPLRTIYVSESALKTLPQSIGNIDKLEVLNVPYNEIEKLPKSITNLRNLRRFELYGNPVAQKEKLMRKLKERLEDCQIVAR